MLMNSILYASSSQGLKNAVMAQMAVALVASTVLPDVTGVRPAPRARAPRGGDGSDASPWADVERALLPSSPPSPAGGALTPPGAPVCSSWRS